jgi:hypothetical protein
VSGDASSLSGLRAAWRLREAVAAHRASERAAARVSNAEIVSLLDATRRRIEARLPSRRTFATRRAARGGDDAGHPPLEAEEASP